MTGNTHGITALTFSPAETTLATGGTDGRIHLLDVVTRRELKILKGAQSTITALTFTVDGTRLFSGEENGTIRQWNALTGTEVGTGYNTPLGAITALSYSLPNECLAAGDATGTIHIFDLVPRRKKAKELPIRHSSITTLIFSDDGNTLVSGSENGTIILWDMNAVYLVEGQKPIPQQNQTAIETTMEQHGITPQQIAQISQKSTLHLLVGDKQGDIFGSGSGFFVRPGYVATNYHVIEDATWIYIKGVGEEKMYVVEGIAATDKSHDLAILKVAEINAPALHLGNSDTVRTGDTVYVVGNPKGLEGTFSKGIVSAIRVDGANTWIQIDAPISPGSSGGAVLNSSGQVIGVATAGLPNKDAQNLNFVVPSNYLKALLRKVR